jgi:hypothetical protein
MRHVVSILTIVVLSLGGTAGAAHAAGIPLFTGGLGSSSDPVTITPGPSLTVQLGVTAINAMSFQDFADYQPVALEWALSMSNTNLSTPPDVFGLSGGTSGTISTPAGETITFGLVDGHGTSKSNFTPITGNPPHAIYGDSIAGTVAFTTYGPDSGSGTLFNAVITVPPGQFADPSGFFSSLGLTNAAGGQLALTLDVNCGATGCIQLSDPTGFASAGVQPLPVVPPSVPEPASGGLILLGLLGAGRAFRRKTTIAGSRVHRRR